MEFFSAFITLFVIILGIFFKQQRELTQMLLLLLFILFAFERTAEGDGDYENYLRSYDAIGLGQYWALESYEPFYLLFCILGNKLNFSFDLARGFVCFIELFFIYRTITKFTRNTSFVLALFFIFPALFDAELFRWFMGFTFVICSIPYLLLAKIGKKSSIISFIVLIICASLSHASCLFFFSLLLLLLNDDKKIIIIVLGISLFLFLASTSSFYSILNFLPIKENIQEKYQTVEFANWHGIIVVFIRQIAVFYLSYLSYRVSCSAAKLKQTNKMINQRPLSSSLSLQKNSYIINIISLLFVPLSVYTPQVLRFLQVPLLLNYISCAYTIELVPKSRKIRIWCFTISVLLLLYMVFFASAGTRPVFMSHFELGYLSHLFSILF